MRSLTDELNLREIQRVIAMLKPKCSLCDARHCVCLPGEDNALMLAAMNAGRTFVPIDPTRKPSCEDGCDPRVQADRYDDGIVFRESCGRCGYDGELDLSAEDVARFGPIVVASLASVDEAA